MHFCCSGTPGGRGFGVDGVGLGLDWGWLM